MQLIYSESGSNWDIFKHSSDDSFVAIAKVEGASNSHFGSKNHVIKLMNGGYFNFDRVMFSEFGLSVFSGLHTVLSWDVDGSINIDKTKKESKWYRIAFN